MLYRGEIVIFFSETNGHPCKTKVLAGVPLLPGEGWSGSDWRSGKHWGPSTLTNLQQDQRDDNYQD